MRYTLQTDAWQGSRTRQDRRLRGDGSVQPVSVDVLGERVALEQRLRPLGHPRTNLDAAVEVLLELGQVAVNVGDRGCAGDGEETREPRADVEAVRRSRSVRRGHRERIQQRRLTRQARSGRQRGRRRWARTWSRASAASRRSRSTASWPSPGPRSSRPCPQAARGGRRSPVRARGVSGLLRGRKGRRPAAPASCARRTP